MSRAICCILIIAAARTAMAQTLPAIRPLGPIERVSAEPLMSVNTTVALSDGRVYVNDVTAHRVLLFDSTLTRAQVVADSTSVTAKAYGPRPGTLFAFHGDSALFVDPASGSMLVLGPDARIDRVIAMPRPSGAPFQLNAIVGVPGFDARGRLVSVMPSALLHPPEGEAGKPVVQQAPDSTLLVEFDLISRVIDTIGSVHTESMRISTVRDANDYMTAITVTPDLLPVVDSWTVERDGSIAVVRGRDFHVDRLGADGKWRSSPKLPFEWEHLSDDQKTAIIDSSLAAIKARRDSVQVMLAQRGPAPAAGDGGGGRGGRGGGTGGGGMPAPMFIDGRPALSDLPDYKPAFMRTAARGDADGNLWIRTTTLVRGQPVYDIVNASGELIDRIQVPPFRTIAGFGPGVVYLAVTDTGGAVHIERARIRQK